MIGLIPDAICVCRSYGVRDMAVHQTSVILKSTITCPACGHRKTETMPTDACQWFYDCRHCGAVLKGHRETWRTEPVNDFETVTIAIY